MFKKVVIFDIDGTLANNGERSIFLRTKPKNWPAFVAGAAHDECNESVMFMAHILATHPEVKLIVLTARDDGIKEMTERWLKAQNVIYDALYMRKEGDSRRDDIVKRELLEVIRRDHGEIFCAFEDRPRVVDMLREEGVFVFAMPWYGED